MDHLTVERSLAKTKKRRRFWRLRRQKEASPAPHQLPEGEEEERWSSTSDGRASPSVDDVAVLSDPSLVVRGSCEQLASGAEEEEEEKAEKDSSACMVRVTVLSGHGLAVRDRSGTSDPYVKVRYGGFKYNTAVKSRSLNPVWNEVCAFKAHNLSIPLIVRVYDHDFASTDDFMGEGSLNLTSYVANMVHSVELGLSDAGSQEDLGFLRLQLELSNLPTSPKEEEEAVDSSQVIQKERNKVKHPGYQLWKSMLTVTLLGARSLPSMDDNGLCDPYCKFKLGNQKYKSKVHTKTLNPEWKERFEMKLYEGENTSLLLEVWDRDFPASDDYIGYCELDLSEYEAEKTYDLTLPLIEIPSSSVHILLVITGTRRNDSLDNWSDIAARYQLLRTPQLKNLRDVGSLRVKVCGADSLSTSKGNAVVNPFVMLEVENAQVRTQTLYKVTNPHWDKEFLFNVGDVHSCLSVSVFSEGKSKDELIGKLTIPLLRVVSGEVKRYALKDKNCYHRTSGSITLQCDLVYNPIKAAVRTINPRETHVLEADQKVKRKVLLRNIRRCTDVVRTLTAAWQFVQSLWSWQSKLRSALAFVVFILACLFGELWMIGVLGIVLILVCYLMFGRPSSSSSSATVNNSTSTGQYSFELDNASDFSDMEDAIQDSHVNKEQKQTLRRRLRQLQDVLLTLQTTTGYVADMTERLKNLFSWSVPFLCWLALGALVAVSLVLFFIPLRYIILLWGINKFTKRLRDPHHIPNQELLDFVSRAPTDAELQQWRELHIKRTTILKKPKHRKKV